MPEKERRRRVKQPVEESAPGERFEDGVHELEDAYFGVRDRLCDVFGLPEEFGVHLRAARREFLLAVRSIIDARIESLEEADKQRDVSRHRRVHID